MKTRGEPCTLQVSLRSNRSKSGGTSPVDRPSVVSLHTDHEWALWLPGGNRSEPLTCSR